MVKNILIICEDSPFGKNSVIESIRMAAGILALGDITNCKVIFMGDAVFLLNRKLNPQAIGMDPFLEMMRLIELSHLNIYIHDGSLENCGLNRSDLIDYKNLKIVNLRVISQLILEADMSFKY